MGQGWSSGCSHCTSQAGESLVLRQMRSLWRASQREDHDQVDSVGRHSWSSEDGKNPEGRTAKTCCSVKAPLPPNTQKQKAPQHEAAPNMQTSDPTPTTFLRNTQGLRLNNGLHKGTLQRQQRWNTSSSGEVEGVPRSNFRIPFPKELCLEGYQVRG